MDSLCSYSPLAFLHPGSAESRLGLVAKLARIDRSQAVQLMSQHPQLWVTNSRLLGPRWACIEVIQRFEGTSGIPQHIATVILLIRNHEEQWVVAGHMAQCEWHCCWDVDNLSTSTADIKQSLFDN